MRLRTCPPLELRPLSSGLSRSAPSATRSTTRRNIYAACRHASSSSGPVTTHHRALTLIHKTRAVLPRILPKDVPGDDLTRSLAFWDGLLSSAQDTLSSSRRPNAKARLAVYAFDAYAGVEELIVALLDDPLGSSPEATHALRQRWNTTKDASFLILDTNTTDSGIQVSSAWLQQLPTSTQLVEIKPGVKTPSAEAALLSADVSVVVWNPASSSLAALQETIRSLSRFFLVVTGTPSTSGLEAHIAQTVTDVHPQQKKVSDMRVVFVDATRATSAVETLRQHLSSAATVQRFQDDFLASGVSKLHKLIREDLETAGAGALPRPALPEVRLRTTLATLQSALNECWSSVRDARRDVDAAYIVIDQLKDELKAVHARAHIDVLGDMDSTASGKAPPAPENDPVGSALAHAEQGVRTTLDRLTWWKLLYKVDDVDFIINSAIARVWFKDLEPQLIMQTGRLSALQGRLAASTEALVAEFPSTSAFHSPVLLNSLAQLTSTSSFPLSVASLTSPLRARQTQLAHPATRLHRAAQRTVAGFGAGVLGSTSLGTAGWMGFLSTGPLANFGLMESPTALGITAVGVLASARWAVGRWERAKGRWWEDWERVGAGVRRDLSNNLDFVVQNQVALIPARAYKELEAKVARRRADIDDLKHELDVLEEELAALRYGQDASSHQPN